MRPQPTPSTEPLNPNPNNSDPLVAVFRGVETVLRNDPLFTATCNVLRAWNGDPADANPPADGEMPWCRITPVNSASGREDESAAIQVTQTITVEMATLGLNADDMGYFYSTFRMALAQDNPTQNSTVLQYLRSKGLYTYEFNLTNFGPRSAPPADPNAPGAKIIRCLYSVGRFTARLILPR